MTRFTTPSALAAVAALALLAACEEAAAPSLSDPAAISADLQQAEAAFQSAAFRSFEELGGVMGGAASQAAAALAPDPSWGEAGPTVRSALKARDLHRLAAELGSLAPQDSFLPDAVLGTYEWDVNTDQYVRTGPVSIPNTVRFILYTVSPITHLPAEPLVPLGHVDFTDNQPIGPALSLDITVRDLAGTVYLTYTGTITWGPGSFTASAVGSVNNGQPGAGYRELEFNVQFSATGSETSGTLSADALFDLNQPDVHIEVHDDATLSGNTVTFTRDFLFEHPGDDIHIVGTVTVIETGPDTYTVTVDVTVYVNGGEFARIVGTGDAVTVTGPGGRELTAEERAALLAILDASDDFWDHVEDFFDPIEDLTG